MRKSRCRKKRRKKMYQVFICGWCSTQFSCAECCKEHEESCSMNPKNESPMIYKLKETKKVDCGHKKEIDR